MFVQRDKAAGTLAMVIIKRVNDSFVINVKGGDTFITQIFKNALPKMKGTLIPDRETLARYLTNLLTQKSKGLVDVVIASQQNKVELIIGQI